MLKDEHLFVLVAARQADLTYLCVRNRELDADDVAHSLFDGYYQGNFGYLGKTTWDAVALAVAGKPSPRMLALSGEGDVFTYAGGADGAEQILGLRGELRRLGVVDGYAYACGMRRQVFRRASEGQWTAMHAPAPTSEDMGRVLGFESIHGFSESELYAVGWAGEIWICSNGAWSQVDSPTDAVLTGVTCADDSVFVIGKNSTLLRGRGSTWQVIDTSEVADDFWSLCWFNDRLYVSSLSRIYELHQDSFYPTSTGDDRPGTCFQLSAADGVMWSVGTDDFFSFDGVKWARIE